MSSDTGQVSKPPSSARGVPSPLPTVHSPAWRRPRGEVAVPLPATIGKYRGLARVGSGAMGVGYKCTRPGLDRPVAVKVLLAARHTGAHAAVRFEREARAAARLTHPNVVQIHDVGTEGDLPWFVMEFVDGCSLDKLIGTPALTLDATLRLVCLVARALQAAHEQGIIHRDIKPSNILLHSSGQPKLADFGLAKLLDDGSALSGSGDIIGTPRYMAPEQVLGGPQDVDARTDVYSLGAVMYEMLTGRPPVEGANVLAVLRKLSDEEPVPLRELNPAVPEEVAAICARALARARQDRFASAAEFAEAVQGYLLERLFSCPEPLGVPIARAIPLLPPALLPPGEPRHRKRALLLSLAAGSVLALAAYRLLGAPGWPGDPRRPGTPPTEGTRDWVAYREAVTARAHTQIGAAPRPGAAP